MTPVQPTEPVDVPADVRLPPLPEPSSWSKNEAEVIRQYAREAIALNAKVDVPADKPTAPAPRELDANEQGVMHAALRRSGKLVTAPAPEVTDALRQIAELEGDCDGQQFKLTRYQAAQIARRALAALEVTAEPLPADVDPNDEHRDPADPLWSGHKTVPTQDVRAFVESLELPSYEFDHEPREIFDDKEMRAFAVQAIEQYLTAQTSVYPPPAESTHPLPE